MANKKEYPGFPKTYVKGDLGRVANNPTDAVNLEHRGFKASEDVNVAADKPTDTKPAVDVASNTAPRPGRATNPNTPQN